MQWIKSHLPGTLFGALLILVGGFALWLFWDLPRLADLPQNLFTPSIRITDRFGRSLYEIQDQSGGRNTPVAIEKIPAALKNATIATEDQNFYQNPGVDFEGILRALWINLRGGETLAGGSTITQQVARNLLLSESEQFERTIRRKLRESWLAWRLTRKMSKDEILGLYLNQMNYGGMAYGVEAAAQTYFGKPAAELNLAESALIAGIPQGPALYNPLVDPEAAKNRQTIVLELMRNQGYITAAEYDLALREPLIFSTDPYPIEAPHFVMMVAAQIDEILLDRPKTQPLIVKTTLDLDWQHLAEEAIHQHLTRLATTDPTGQGHNVPGGHNIQNAALVALAPDSGEILALVGSPDYFDAATSGAINMALAPRQPGSALKPLVYAAAFDPSRPEPYTPATTLLDIRTTFSTHDDEPYTPSNFDNQEHGLVSVRQALASSLNIPAVITLEHVGIAPVMELAEKMGISTFGNPDDYDLSLALGGGEVRLLELTAAYGVFANTGYHLPPFFILEITTPDGELLYQHRAPTPVQVLDERIAWLISDILSDNQARSIGFGPNTALKIDRPAAVKTGTTTNFHDNWTVGYTPDLVVGVWVGNANHEPMRAVTGLSGAAPIWHQFIRSALIGTPKRAFARPEGLTRLEVCALSGLLPSENCPYTKWEWFLSEIVPLRPDTLYQRVWIDRTTGLLASESTPPANHQPVVALDLPPQAQPWAHSQGLTLLSDLQLSGSAGPNWDQNPLQIIHPANHAVYQVDPLRPVDEQKLRLQAASTLGLTAVQFWLNGQLLGQVDAPPYELWWPISPGEHQLWVAAVGPDGQLLQSAGIYFSVQME